MNLLAPEMRDYVQPTALSKKLTLDGVTKAYPVYRVRLDCLFYNEQNDRIATWISQYKNEHGSDSFRNLTQAQYNSIIEEFIIQSNPSSIERTQLNIELVGQRESGVILSDGRIIDGNRRYTCLRRLSESNMEFNWFETVILDVRMKSSRKQIKMLELAIQHGEEKKVDYNPLERLVGVYQDIMKTGLLTPEEYADSTNESLIEVRKRMEHAGYLIEFLDYIGMPEQYHIAREYQAVTIFTEMGTVIKKCKREMERETLKRTIYNNIFMGTIGDGRKYIRNLSSMMEGAIFNVFIKQQNTLNTQIEDALRALAPKNLDDLKEFVLGHGEWKDELINLMDNTIIKARKREVKAKPSQSISKSIIMLKDVDVKIFDILSEEEKDKLAEKVDLLSYKVNVIRQNLGKEALEETAQESGNASFQTTVTRTSLSEVRSPEYAEPKTTIDYRIAAKHIEEPFVSCIDMNKPITNLTFSLRFRADAILDYQNEECVYRIFFVSSRGEVISEKQEIKFSTGSEVTAGFTLSSSVSDDKVCYLAMQSVKDEENVLQQKIPFDVKISFAADFGF